MIVLALDTCLAACSAAVVEDGRGLASSSEPMTRGHQERLASMTREVMEAAGHGFAAVDRIGVTVGPGSFTGLRVGLAFAKGLALALGRPCVGVGTLEALAASLGEAGPLTAVIDAGRGRIYLQSFDGATPVSGPDVLPIDLALARLAEICPSGEMILTGPGADLLKVALPRATVAPRETADPVVVGRVAARLPLARPRPLYLRPPDAKVKAA